MYHEINKYRQQYVYDRFVNNQNLLLNWDRNIGKTKYSVTCILDYAISHPSTHNLITGHNDSATLNLHHKMVDCNRNTLVKTVKKSYQRTIVLNNESVIYFGSKQVKEKNILNTLLVDEITEFTRSTYLPNLLLSHDRLKILINCTDYNNAMYSTVRKVLMDNNVSLFIDEYMGDDDLLVYMRGEKIQKIVKNI